MKLFVEKIVDLDFDSYLGQSSNWQDQPGPMGLFDRPRFPPWKYDQVFQNLLKVNSQKDKQTWQQEGLQSRLDKGLDHS